MKRKERILLFVVVAAGLLLFLFSKPPIAFTRLDDAKVRIETAGYHCTPDTNKNELGNGFLVTREEISRGQVRELCKVGKLGPEWQGKVWVAFNATRFPLVTLPDDASIRQWGRVIVFGDGTLLDELEQRLQRSRLGSVLRQA